MHIFKSINHYWLNNETKENLASDIFRKITKINKFLVSSLQKYCMILKVEKF